MTRSKKQMALTRELVATTVREIKNPGPPPGSILMSDEDYDVAVRDVLSQAPPGPIWFFAYGSLLWKPAGEIVERRAAVVRGWHRAFCFRDPWARGTPDQPGLMMALDRGGQCQGMVFRLAEPVESLVKLFKREMHVRRSVYIPRWLMAQTSDEPVRAIGFVIDRHHKLYVGKLTIDEIVGVLSKAAGHLGSGAEYLYETVSHLENLDIHDRYLWRLQRLLADRITGIGRNP